MTYATMLRPCALRPSQIMIQKGRAVHVQVDDIIHREEKLRERFVFIDSEFAHKLTYSLISAALQP